MSSKGLRVSKRISIPETFVTIEIHNQTSKNKYRQHRSSVLNQLKATQVRLDQSLNSESIKSIKNHSSFSIIKTNMKSDKGLITVPNSIFRGKKNIQISEDSIKQETEQKNSKHRDQPQYKISPEINIKLKQLTNITHQFERACEKKKQKKHYDFSTQKSYYLPAVQETQIQGPQKQNIEQQNMKKRWKDKIKKGKNLIQKIKANATFYNRIKEQKLQEQEHEQRQKSQRKESYESLRQRFFDPLVNERKSAPVNSASTSFYNIFCSQKPETSCFYDRRVELQPISHLQKFASGGDSLAFQQDSQYINVRQFIKNRQKLSFLKRFYNYTKQKCPKYKDMKCTQFNDPNLLSMLFYIQNQASMTGAEKRYLRKKLNFID